MYGLVSMTCGKFAMILTCNVKLYMHIKRIHPPQTACWSKTKRVKLNAPQHALTQNRDLTSYTIDGDDFVYTRFSAIHNCNLPYRITVTFWQTAIERRNNTGITIRCLEKRKWLRAHTFTSWLYLGLWIYTEDRWLHIMSNGELQNVHFNDEKTRMNSDHFSSEFDRII